MRLALRQCCRRWVTLAAASAAALASICATARAEFTIFYYQDGRRINNITQAQNLIDTTLPVAIEVTDTISFRDNRTNSGHFLSDQTVVPLTNQDNFAVFVSGQIFADQAGDYTFNVHSDDGYSLSINGSVVSAFTRPRAPRDTTDANIYLDQGYHTLEIVYFERTGRAVLEVSHAFGNFPNFAAGAGAFNITVASNPEPGQWALMILSFVMVAGRMKTQRAGGSPVAAPAPALAPTG